MPGPRIALRSGEARAGSLRIHDSRLTRIATVIDLRQLLQGLLRGFAGGEEGEAVRSVSHVRIRLRRDGTHLRLRPRHHAADAEELALHRHAQITRLRIETND